MKNTNNNTESSMVLDRPEQIEGFRIRVIQSAIKLYLDHGIRANRFATPQNLRNLVSQITGIAYPRSRKGLEQAGQDLLTLYPKF
jgi:hypothetical protein